MPVSNAVLTLNKTEFNMAVARSSKTFETGVSKKVFVVFYGNVFERRRGQLASKVVIRSCRVSVSAVQISVEERPLAALK